jgi:hypothetical protein
MAGAERLTRGQLLRRGGVAAAGVAVFGAAAGASEAEARHRKGKKKKWVYRLVPRDKGCTKRENRKRLCACNACYQHAKYKLFPTKDAADGNRAHPRCNCRIKKAGKLKHSTYVALFGGTGKKIKRYSVDRRKRRTKRLLRRG